MWTVGNDLYLCQGKPYALQARSRTKLPVSPAIPCTAESRLFTRTQKHTTCSYMQFT